jgi:hypothetical protein
LHLREKNMPHGNMKVVKHLLWLPGNSAYLERVFSSMNYISSEEKSRVHVDTIEAILAMETNVHLSCETFSEIFPSNPGLLEKIIHQKDTMASQGPPQNNEGTVKVIMSHVLRHIIFLASIRRLVHYFQVPYPLTYIIYRCTSYKIWQ